MRPLLLIALAAALTACKGSTTHGECQGIDESEWNPGLEYSLSARNAIISFVLIETIIVPAFWLTDYAYCPIGRKAP